MSHGGNQGNEPQGRFSGKIVGLAVESRPSTISLVRYTEKFALQAYPDFACFQRIPRGHRKFLKLSAIDLYS
jgi:hypothetical protein